MRQYPPILSEVRSAGAECVHCMRQNTAVPSCSRPSKQPVLLETMPQSSTALHMSRDQATLHISADKQQTSPLHLTENDRTCGGALSQLRLPQSAVDAAYPSLVVMSLLLAMIHLDRKQCRRLTSS
ncbi:hypothetical protein, unlikely [Trypanosoma congolense IL3000]|uniref:Uncharacterized protein n=1 Tax=Trypanosoma congolense (strain IL3000) TaxID=1068625 RepID=F9WDF6_TRYCI|nr:hypothetical protein, unlikely [Trypanosoma congolense IL3000]